MYESFLYRDTEAFRSTFCWIHFLLEAGKVLLCLAHLNVWHHSKCLAQNTHSINICWVYEWGLLVNYFFPYSTSSRSSLHWLSLKRQPQCKNSFGGSPKTPVSNPRPLNDGVTVSKFSNHPLCLIFLIYEIVLITLYALFFSSTRDSSVSSL